MSRRVCMLLTDPELTDYRVIHEATSLVEAGYVVRVVMPGFTGEEIMRHAGGFEVCRTTAAWCSSWRLLPLAITSSWYDAFHSIEDKYRNRRAENSLTASLQRKFTAAHDGKADVRRVQIVFERSRKFGGRLLSLGMLMLGLKNNWDQNRLLQQEVAFAQKVREFQPDIIHAHDLPTLRLARHLATELQAKLVYDAHELYPVIGGRRKFILKQCRFVGGMRGRAVRYFTEREKADIHTPNLILTVNAYLAEAFKQIYGVRNIHVIHNTVPYRHFLAGNRKEQRAKLLHTLSVPRTRTCVLLYLGYLHQNRGLAELVDALALLPSHYVLVVLGDGRERKRMERQVRKLKLEKRVVFHGEFRSEAAADLIAGADIGLVAQHPTGLNEINCSPNRLSEYLMAGLPLAVSDLPFLRRFVEDYECGELFDPKNPRHIAQTVQSIFENAEKFENLRRRAFAAAKQFNWDVEGRKFLKLYAALHQDSSAQKINRKSLASATQVADDAPDFLTAGGF